MLCIRTNKEDQTRALGERLGKLVFRGCLIALYGDLGAGKTAFTRGLCNSLGIERVSSPSYTIMNLYEGSLPVYHFDAYRLADEDEFYALGGDEYFGSGLCIVEWPDKIEGALPQQRLDISIRNLGETEREFCFSPKGERYKTMIGGL